jgi:hypothetical protein
MVQRVVQGMFEKAADGAPVSADAQTSRPVPGDMVVCLSRLRRLEEIMDCIEHPLVIVTR